ncbi:hypothetical protein AAFN85_21615 [Mucilaginibacter sp. CAU 1740]|uniref:hypothetical protein n=1 Tax=Mucilaginibacter sp. CAU 1740 TaxID=3140365 RepID=UPI00325BAA80
MLKPKLYLIIAFFKGLILTAGAQVNKNAPAGSTNTGNFSQSFNTAVFTTKFVINDKHDIVLVRCEPEDGALMFYSADKFDNYEAVAKIVGLGQLLKLDTTLLQIPVLKPGFYAHRSKKGKPWVVERLKSKD